MRWGWGAWLIEMMSKTVLGRRSVFGGWGLEKGAKGWRKNKERELKMKMVSGR